MSRAEGDMTNSPTKRSYVGDNGYTYGPDFEVIPALTLRVNPSRSDTRCPICGKPVDVRGKHAVIHERFEGKVVGGRYAHAECCDEGNEVRRRVAGPGDLPKKFLHLATIGRA